MTDEPAGSAQGAWLEELRRDHQPYTVRFGSSEEVVCSADGQFWPCGVSHLLAARARDQARIAELCRAAEKLVANCERCSGSGVVTCLPCLRCGSVRVALAAAQPPAEQEVTDGE